jgi:hypothetical protein
MERQHCSELICRLRLSGVSQDVEQAGAARIGKRPVTSGFSIHNVKYG